MYFLSCCFLPAFVGFIPVFLFVSVWCLVIFPLCLIYPVFYGVYFLLCVFICHGTSFCFHLGVLPFQVSILPVCCKLGSFLKPWSVFFVLEDLHSQSVGILFVVNLWLVGLNPGVCAIIFYMWRVTSVLCWFYVVMFCKCHFSLGKSLSGFCYRCIQMAPLPIFSVSIPFFVLYCFTFFRLDYPFSWFFIVFCLFHLRFGSDNWLSISHVCNLISLCPI